MIAQWKTPSLSHQTSFQENYADVAHLIPPPDFAIVLDTSGSMDTCTTFSPDEIQRLNLHLQQQIDTGKLDSTAAIQQFIHTTHKEPSRITLAKKAIQQLLPHLHANILIHFYSFDGNDSPHYHGLYPVTHRQALIDTIQQLQASGGTPLINTLIEASNTMDGVNNDALILCFIDGDDNSNWILSEFVQQLKASKPRLRINIVDISQEGSMDLLALETGGRVYKSHKPKQIIKDILQSTNEIAAKPKKK